MSGMLIKNTLRDISRTKSRFISIVLIIMLGVGFLVGIYSTAPTMYASAEEYYNTSNLMDFRLISTVGFSEEDIEEIEKIEGVSSVMPSYFADVSQKGDNANIYRLIAMPEKYMGEEINTPALREGRLPEKDNEIVLGYKGGMGDVIGTTVQFESPKAEDTLSESLENTEYKVVGIVDSPLYISFERGYTNVGSGSVYNYALINGSNFKIGRYTEVYITFENLRGLSPFSQEYKRVSEENLERLESFGEERASLFERENIKAAESSLDEAQILINQKKASAFFEIEQAEAKIKSGEKELKDATKEGRDKLVSAKSELEAGEDELASQQTLMEKKLSEAEAEILSAEEKLSQGEEDIAKGKEEIRNALYEQFSKFGISEKVFNFFLPEGEIPTASDINSLGGLVEFCSATINFNIEKTQELISFYEKRAEITGKAPEDYLGYKTAVKTLATLQEAEEGLQSFLTSGKEELISAIEKIEEGEKALEESRPLVESARDEFEEEKALAEGKLADARAQLDEGWSDYYAGLRELDSKEKEALDELIKAKNQLAEKSEEAQTALILAQAEIDKAYARLKALPDPEWYCYDRDENPGYSSYEDNVERVNSVGSVFPVFFMLVAILVCVTTMSRLVEEQRGDVGALTTLGYRPIHIISKYIAYSASATVVGSILGSVVGLLVIPSVIFNAYGILYKLPSFVLTLNVPSMIIAVVVALMCTCLVAVASCYSLVRNKPAALLRPKAPKPGKRILLERIPFLWKHLGFFAKVTARNIFRYKARFLMTIIGVAGCTALIFAGFGLYNSITDIVDKQFKEIFTYDAMLVAKSGGVRIDAITEALSEDERIADFSVSRQTLVTVSKDDKSLSDNVYIMVPENTDDFEKIINLKERTSQRAIELTGEGCILTEKLATSINAKVGDTVLVADNDREAQIKVTGICENYLYGYIYMDYEAYVKAFDQNPTYGVVACKYAEGKDFDEDSFSKEYIDSGNVLAVSVTSKGVANFSNMIQALNYVVMVMIASAAALAFVVLYNLTNINIAERKREISTLKVLGFKSGETSAYINRENILLTLVGTAAGLLFGTWLLSFIIKTVEVNMVMFGREVHFMSFFLATALTLVFSTAVNLIIRIKLKKIDMVESLKSVD